MKFTEANIEEIIVNRTSDFVQDIEGIVEDQGLDYMEALVAYSDTHNLEVEAVGEIVANVPVIRERLAIEAEAKNLLPKVTRLEF